MPQPQGPDHEYANDHYCGRTLDFVGQFHLLGNDKNIKKNIVAFENRGEIRITRLAQGGRSGTHLAYIEFINLSSTIWKNFRLAHPLQ